jgi:FKBP-type peptidyl-prolyl cis-trans isomerase
VFEDVVLLNDLCIQVNLTKQKQSKANQLNSNKNKQKQTKTNKNKQKQTKTNKNKQKQTKTNKNKIINKIKTNSLFPSCTIESGINNCPLTATRPTG